MPTVNPAAMFAAIFLLGVAGAVYVIVRGVERPARHASLPVDAFGRETGVGKVSLRAPVVAAALIALGSVGSTLVRLTTWPAWAALAGGAAAAAVAAPVSAWLVRRWAMRAAVEDLPDPRYALQGHIARVVQAAAGREPASVTYTANGRRVVAAACSLDQTPLVAGTDVVIDRLEDGVVYVEAWARVEQRL
jgi:hypothetical protein